MKRENIQASYLRKMAPLSITAFLSVLIDGVLLISLIGCRHDLLPLVYFVGAYLIVQPFSGYLADRFPKRTGMVLGKSAELILLAVLYPYAQTYSLPLAFLFGLKTACFGNFFRSSLADSFDENELSEANGLIAAMEFLAVIAVFAATWLGLGLSGTGGLLAVSFAGLAVTLTIVPCVSAVQQKKELAYSFFESRKMLWSAYHHKFSILMAEVVDAFFLAVGIALEVLIVLITVAKAAGSGSGTLLTMLAPLFGMALGCYLAGQMSKRKIELGFVPFGALGVAIMLPCAAYLHGQQTLLVLPFLPRAMAVYIPSLIYLVFVGIFGGLFIIPLRAFYQHRMRPELRGAAQSIHNISFILLSAVLVVLIIANRTPADGNDLTLMYAFVAGLGGIIFVVTLISMLMLPEFMLRFVTISLGSTFYRIRIRGAENVPEHGAALLISNHVSLIDSVLISACTSRRIRFLMSDNYYKFPFVTRIANLTGFIRVPGAGETKRLATMLQEVRRGLSHGDVICIFPEGKMTRNGGLGRFRSSFEKMLPENHDVPVIPVYIGNIWGSMFSLAFDRLKFRMPREFPYRITVTFGKPMPRILSAFAARQQICELAAESNLERVPKERPLHYCVLRAAHRTPSRIQFTDSGSGETYSNLRLAVKSILLSRLIRQKTETAETRIGVLLPNGCSAAVAFLSILYADKTFVPLNPTATQETFTAALRKAELKHIITTHDFLANLRVKPEEGSCNFIYIEDELARQTQWQKAWLKLAILLLPYREILQVVSPLTFDHIDFTAAVLFSSGSTGVPKGAMLSQHNLTTNAIGFVDLSGLTPDDLIVGNLPMFHSYGLHSAFWSPLLHGIPVVFLANPIDASGFSALMQKYHPSVLFATPSFLQIYMRRCKPEDFASLRLTFTGAEKLRDDIAERYRSMMNEEHEVVELYGATEVSPFISLNVPVQRLEIGQKTYRPGSIGIPLPNLSVRIVDPLTYQPLPARSEGLLFVHGSAVMRGYLNDPELTGKVMFDGYYNTGDVAEMDESGYLTIRGRLSRFSKIAGEMVPHELVERTINEMFDPEKRVVAIGSIPDPAKGEALLVLYTDAMPLTPGEVVDALREKSISNLWIPKAVNFYKVERLPLLASGKLDLSILRETAARIAAERNIKI